MTEPLPPQFRREVEAAPGVVDPGLTGGDDDAPHGIVCPRCQCPDMRVGRTIDVTGAVKRYRYCRACNRGLPTEEVPTSFLNDLMRRARID